MKKNSNYIIIGVIVLFVAAWQFMVVQPYMDEQRIAREAQNPVDNKVIETQADAETSESYQTQETLKNTSISSKQRNFKEAVALFDVYVEPKRKLSFNSDGSFYNYEFEDFKTRDNKSNVQILSQKFHLKSNHPQVENCLKSLSLVGATQQFPLKFNSNNGTVQCELIYSQDNNNLINISFFVKASSVFSAEHYIRFQSSDSIDPDAFVEDQKGLDVKIDGEKEDYTEEDIFKEERLAGKLDWLMWGDKYFGLILTPQGKFNPHAVKGPLKRNLSEVNLKTDKAYFGFEYPLEIFNASLKETDDIQIKMFLGVMKSDLLASVIPVAEDSKRLGFYSYFRGLVNIVITILNFIFSYINNYGFAIILLTIVVKLLLWPLHKKSIVSGVKMKSVQPQIDTIRKKYGNNKEHALQMNKEIMALYKTNSVNPFGTCLPLLLQFPIFIALYGALRNSIDLYQAPFMGWITDLSSPDPFYILPVLWTVSMFATMWFNPQMSQKQPGMPDMRIFMLGMNVVIGFLSKDWPAGVMLYLVVSAMIGVLQQFMIQRVKTSLQPVKEGV